VKGSGRAKHIYDFRTFLEGLKKIMKYSNNIAGVPTEKFELSTSRMEKKVTTALTCTTP
jgi:hypothetical protein